MSVIKKELSKAKYDFIEDELFSEISSFESFFNNIGFKRLDGTVYGLLVLSKRPLTSEEIEKALNLSQSAVSNSLKVLTHYGAVCSRISNNERRVKHHMAKEDSMTIVSSVFRKREQEFIQEFKTMAQRVLELKDSKSIEDESVRTTRINSILNTCEIAESVVDFVIKVAKKSATKEYSQIAKHLPKTLELLSTGIAPMGQIGQSLRDGLKNKFLQTMEQVSSDRSQENQ